MDVEREIAEQATGCRQHTALGKLYADGGRELTREEAQGLIRTGGSVEVPNAGAGSYRQIFVDVLGYKQLEVENTGSSAGDWQFAVEDEDGWHLAEQDNRYPYHGFRYTVATRSEGSVEDVRAAYGE